MKTLHLDINDTPFGDDWFNAMMKKSKLELVDLLRTISLQKMELENQIPDTKEKE